MFKIRDIQGITICKYCIYDILINLSVGFRGATESACGGILLLNSLSISLKSFLVTTSSTSLSTNHYWFVEPKHFSRAFPFQSTILSCVIWIVCAQEFFSRANTTSDILRWRRAFLGLEESEIVSPSQSDAVNWNRRVSRAKGVSPWRTCAFRTMCRGAWTVNPWASQLLEDLPRYASPEELKRNRVLEPMMIAQIPPGNWWLSTQFCFHTRSHAMESETTEKNGMNWNSLFMAAFFFFFFAPT